MTNYKLQITLNRAYVPFSFKKKDSDANSHVHVHTIQWLI